MAKKKTTIEERFQGLCHEVLNLVSIMKSLSTTLERHNLDSQNIIGQMAHRCGEAEAAIRKMVNESKHENKDLGGDNENK